MSDIIKKRITIRLDDTLKELLTQYMLITKKTNVSETIRLILSDGLYQKSKWVMEQRFYENINTRNVLDLKRKCEKCGNIENLLIYHIDGNVNNNSSNNIVTLCKKCFLNFEVTKVKQEILREKFIEWWFT